MGLYFFLISSYRTNLQCYTPPLTVLLPLRVLNFKALRGIASVPTRHLKLTNPMWLYVVTRGTLKNRKAVGNAHITIWRQKQVRWEYLTIRLTFATTTYYQNKFRNRNQSMVSYVLVIRYGARTYHDISNRYTA